MYRFSGSDDIETGRLLLTDRFHPSSAFNSAHVASLSESGVSRATGNKEDETIETSATTTNDSWKRDSRRQAIASLTLFLQERRCRPVVFHRQHDNVT